MSEDPHDQDLVVEKVVPGGRGFARLPDGRPALIAGAFPGDRVRLQTVRDRGSYVEASAEVLEQAPEHSQDALCSVVDMCGGCDWMRLRLDAQRQYKLAIVQEALRRTGGFHDAPLPQLAAAGAAWGYRSRIRLQIQGGKVGFYAASSHQLVEPDECLVSAPQLQRALNDLRDCVRKHVGQQGHVFDVFSYVEVRCAPSGAVSLYFAPQRGRRVPNSTRKLLEELAEEFAVVVQGETSSAWEKFELEDCYLLATPGTFTQVNWEVNQALVRAVVSGAIEQKCSTFADLYCGNGNFSLPLAVQGLMGRGVEASAASVAAARRAAAEQGLQGVEFEVGNVGDVASQWAEANRRFDLVVVDPPRAGAKGALDAITRLTGRRLAMISCDPVTLARDLRGLVERGFVLEQVFAFDMFPQTHHVECLAWLRPGLASSEYPLK